MSRSSQLFLAGIYLTVPVAAEDFPPIPAESWLIKNEATQGTGAVYLETWIRVDSAFVEFQLRIRILSEAGKRSAEFVSFGMNAYDIVGRTVESNGKATPFTKKDFVNKTVYRVGSTSVERSVLIPPGLTSDCIVDLKWKESKSFYSAIFTGFGTLQSFNLSKPFPVKKANIEVQKNFPWAWSMFPGKAGSLVKGLRDSNPHFVLTDLPVVDELPYAIAGARKTTRLILWKTPPALYTAAKEGPDEYWNEVGRLILKSNFEDELIIGKPFRALSEELRKNRPAGDQDFAIELARRLNSRIRNLSHPTFEEKARQTKSQSEQGINSRNLKVTAERGYTDGWGMVCLFFQILKDEGIKPKIALVANRNRWLFDRKLLTFQQFEEVLLGVEEAGKGVAWFNPADMGPSPNLINQAYQGTHGLLYDSTTWKAQPFTVPVQESSINHRRSEYLFEMDEEADRFKLKVDFAGLQEFQQRRGYRALEAKEQNRLLKERLEKDWPRVEMKAVEVQNTTDLRKNVAFKVEGRISRDPGRKREFDPFPLDAPALWVPERLDPSREEPIVLPHALVHSAISKFKIPNGYVLGKVESMEQGNEIGSVAWKVMRESNAGVEECTVSLRVEVTRPIAPASEYSSLRKFLEWVREASRRTLILERVQ